MPELEVISCAQCGRHDMVNEIDHRWCVCGNHEALCEHEPGSRECEHCQREVDLIPGMEVRIEQLRSGQIVWLSDRKHPVRVVRIKYGPGSFPSAIEVRSIVRSGTRYIRGSELYNMDFKLLSHGYSRTGK